MSGLAKFHCHSLILIQWTLQIVMAGRLSLRAMAVVWELLEPCFGEAPGYSTVRLWLYRVGLFLWQRTPPRADDWILLLDHVAEVVGGKCLLIVGVRRSTLRCGQFELTHYDIVVLHAEVMASSTGADIHRILNQVTAHTGTPVQCVSDHGSDILKGLKLYQAEHPEVVLTWDITHRLARLWLAAIAGDERWTAFREHCRQTRTKTERGPLRFLAPPSTAGSTRCDHFDRLTLWGVDLLAYQDRGDFSQIDPRHVWDMAAKDALPDQAELSTRLQPLLDRPFADRATFVAAVSAALGPDHAEHVPSIVRAADQGRREFDLRYGWAESFRADLKDIYEPLVRLGYAAETQIKAEGLHIASARRWLASVPGDWLRRPRVQRFTVALLRYLHTEGRDRRPEEALLGTSDVLESLFGKYKHFSERGPLRELGASLLLLPLATVRITTDLVREALSKVRVKTFEAFRRLTFGSSTLSRRRLAFSVPPESDDTKPS